MATVSALALELTTASLELRIGITENTKNPKHQWRCIMHIFMWCSWLFWFVFSENTHIHMVFLVLLVVSHLTNKFRIVKHRA